MSDPFNKLLVPHVQSVDMTSLRRLQVINQYAQHNIADPTIGIADRTAPSAIPQPVGEDGQAMTVERRAQLMIGRRTAKDIGDEQRLTNKSIEQIHDYRLDDVAIQIERLGQAAEAARLPWRVVKAGQLPSPIAPPVVSNPADLNIQDVSNCCYSAVYLSHGQVFWRELVTGMTKVAQDSALQLSPTEIWMSGSIRAVVENWRQGQHYIHGPSNRLFDMHVLISDRLENEVRVYADVAAGQPRRYAALFIARDLYEGLSIDVQVATERLPVVHGEPHGQDHNQTHTDPG